MLTWKTYFTLNFTEAFSEYSVSLAASTSVGLGSTVIKVSKTAEGGMLVTVYPIILSKNVIVFKIE